jgi:HK97 family phage major capsid protein
MKVATLNDTNETFSTQPINAETFQKMLESHEAAQQELKRNVEPILRLMENNGHFIPGVGERITIKQLLSSDDAPELLPVAFDERIRSAQQNLQNLRQYTRYAAVDAKTTYFPTITAMRRSYIQSNNASPENHGIIMDTVDITCEDYEQAASIDKNTIKDSRWNALGLILDAVGYSMKIGENIDIMNAYVEGAKFQSAAAGNRFNIGQISDLIAMIEETQQFIPSVMFVGTEIGSKIRKMPEFQNAAFFGGRDIWISGKLTNLFGLQIIVTPFLDRDREGNKRDTRKVVVLDGNFPAIFASLEETTVGSEDSFLNNLTHTVARERRQIKVVDNKACAVINGIDPATLLG